MSTVHAFAIRADIVYLDGPLTDLVIPDGYSVSYDNRESAFRASRWINDTRKRGDFVRAAVTGHRYVFTSGPTVTEGR